MKKVFIISGIIFVAIIVGIFFINIYEANTRVTEETTVVGLILNGNAHDGSWSQAHYEGLKKTSEELNLSIVCKEMATAEQMEQLVEELVDAGCEIIIANSFEFGEYMEVAASRYPDIFFYHATGVGEGKNLSSYFGRMYQIRYLCGVVAGMETKTNEIGYVAAFPIPEVNRGINAFTLGVRSVNKDAVVYVRWTNSWTEDGATQEATEKLLNEHSIDVLAMHTDSLAPLMIADEKGVMTIGYNTDNGDKYPETYLTAAVWDWEKFYTPNILRCLQGKFEGYHYWEGIETGIVSMAPYADFVKDETKEAVEREKQRMISGTYDVFYGPITDNNGTLRVAEGESMTDYVMLNEFDWYVEGVVIDEE